MSVIVEVVHTVSPGTAENFERYVERYNEVSIPLMEECGMNVAGAWRFCTGQVNRDLLVIPYESMGAHAEASAKIQKAIADGRIEKLRELGLRIEERVNQAQTLPYATPERLEDVRNGNTGKPRRYLYSLQKAPLAKVAETIEAQSKLVAALAGTGMELVTAYLLTTGDRGQFVHIWAVEDEATELAFRSTAEQRPALAGLRGLLAWETLDYLEPLSYSRLQ